VTSFFPAAIVIEAQFKILIVPGVVLIRIELFIDFSAEASLSSRSSSTGLASPYETDNDDPGAQLKLCFGLG